LHAYPYYYYYYYYYEDGGGDRLISRMQTLLVTDMARFWQLKNLFSLKRIS
jgi:hypothetical protein